MAIIETVRVINKNNNGRLVDRYGGVEYRFPAGEATVIPAEAARHIFGYGLNEKEREAKFRRSGLALQSNGRRIWSNFVIKEPDRGADKLHPADAEASAR